MPPPAVSPRFLMSVSKSLAILINLGQFEISSAGGVGMANGFQLAVFLSHVRNRYLDSQMRLKIPMSRYLRKSAQTKAVKTMFTAGSTQLAMRILRADSSSF